MRDPQRRLGLRRKIFLRAIQKAAQEVMDGNSTRFPLIFQTAPGPPPTMNANEVIATASRTLAATAG